MHLKKLLIIALLAVVCTGCTTWKLVYVKTLPVTISAEQKAKFESDLAKWDGMITNYKPEAVTPEVAKPAETKKADPKKVTPTTPLDAPATLTKEVQTPEIDTRPPFDYFVEKARALTGLGKVGKAIETYDTALAIYEVSIVGWNNLAKLYESIGDYKTAITYYEKILERFSADEYYLDIAHAALATGDRIKARDAYVAYVHKTGIHDTDLEQALDLKLPTK